MSTELPRETAVSWFDPLYEAAGRNMGNVPWANEAPCPLVPGFLADRTTTGSAVVVGCGLGDDAEAVAAAGYRTVAFDVSQHAVEWCRDRFPNSAVEYQVTDLLNLPKEMIGRFDLVVEVRTIQSLPPSLRTEAIDGTAALVAPGGCAFVVALARPEGTVPSGPPWALSASEINRFEEAGLEVDVDSSADGHFVLELIRRE
jgi:SAM-dependent methyltransferase